MDRTGRRLDRLAGHLSSTPVKPMANPRTPEEQRVQLELQMLLEHDSHVERQNMKDIMRSELFTP